MASLIVAYALWALGGFVGLHHLYLKRYCHCFTWLTTGGGLGLGVLWDFCELPSYVDEASNRSEYIRDYSSGSRHPRCSTLRFLGQLVLGYWLGQLTLLAFPMLIWDASFGCFMGSLGVSLGIAWGVYVVGNIGLQERSFRRAAVAAWPLTYLFLSVGGSQATIAYSVICSALVCNRTVKWRSRSSLFTWKSLMLWTGIYSLLWLSMLSWNVRISVNGKVVTLGSAVWEETTSEGWSGKKWTDFHEYLGEGRSWEEMMEDLKEFLTHFAETRTFISPNEVERAYEVIGLGRSVSQQDIRSRCRQLMREYHPDRTKNSNVDMFVKIQEACEILNPRSSPFRNREDL